MGYYSEKVVALDGLPEEKLHCSVLGITGLRKAIQDHFVRYIGCSGGK